MQILSARVACWGFLYLIVKMTFEEIGEHNNRNRKGKSDNEIIDSPVLL